MRPLTGDLSLYIKQTQGSTIGILGSYVDDCLFASIDSFDDLIKMTIEHFETQTVKLNNVEFLGVTTVRRQAHETFWNEINQ